MYRNIIPAVCAVIVTILLASFLSKKNGVLVTEMDIEESHNRELPAFWKAILGPVVVIALLSLRSICGIASIQ